jgi:hypothetical protein
VQSAIVGSSWLCRLVREISVADWLEDLADIPEDTRNLHVQYKRPGYIRQGRVVLNSAHPQSAPPGRARCRFRSVVPWRILLMESKGCVWCSEVFVGCLSVEGRTA